MNMQEIKLWQDETLESHKFEPGYIVGKYGPFQLRIEDQYLIVSVPNEADRQEITDDFRAITDNLGSRVAEYDIFESIWCNGVEFFTADEIGRMSEAPCFATFIEYPDWIANLRESAAHLRGHDKLYWLLPDYYRIDWNATPVWSAIEYYQIRSPLDDIADHGFAKFRLAE